jgi:hypothetical protein
MKIKDRIIEYLEEQPLFRERSNKDRGIVNLLSKRHKALGAAIEQGIISKEEVTRIVQDYASMDRAWRQALEHNPALRGSDYAEKERLEQEKQIELGYGGN